MKIIGICSAALMLSGCMTARMTPAETTSMIGALKDAGCEGDVHLDIGAGTGQLGGEAHAGLKFDGGCHPPKVVPLSHITSSELAGQ